MSNSLAVLAAEIREEHEATQLGGMACAVHANEAGKRLLEASNAFGSEDGNWTRWVKREAGLPYRTARLYLLLSVHIAKGTVTLQFVADVGLVAGLRAGVREDRRRNRVEPGETNVDFSRCTLLQRDVAALLEDAPCSVDWIVTDPPYPREYLPLYDDLARGAAHVLKPGGGLLCMVGQSWLPAVMFSLVEHLNYHWTLAYLTPGGQAVQMFDRHVNTFWKPVLLFTKAALNCDWFGDVTRSKVNDNDKDHHHWGQSESGMADLMRRFVRPGQIVLDPFLGGGTTAVVALSLGASFIGSDIDGQAINTTRARLAHAELVG